MRSLIVIGSQEEKDKYIKKYISDNDVKKYNIFEFNDKLKIADAKQIKKNLSLTGNPTKRFVLVRSDLTIEAQNTLLKTLEELPLNTDVIFFAKSREDLLPTIVSRSFLVNLGREKEGADDKSFEAYLSGVINKSPEDKIRSTLLFIDEVFKKKSKDFKSILESEMVSVEYLVLSLRNQLLTLSKKTEKTEEENKMLLFTLKIISSLMELYPFLLKNNLNRRMVLEKTFLENL